MSEDNNKTVSKDNNKVVSEDNKTVGEDDNKIVIEYNNTDNDDNNNDNDNKNDNENDDDYRIKEINNIFKKIDETKSFEEQINLLKEMDLGEYWHIKYDYDKELNLKIFMLKIAHLSNDLDEMLFEKIFGRTFVTLANKLINTTKKKIRCLLMILKKIKIKYTSKMNIVNL